MKQIFILVCLFTISNISSATINSTGTGGNWSSTGNWAGGVVPSGNDDVVIASGTTVTIDDASASCSNLTVHGTLQFPDVTDIFNLYVNADLTVASDGSLIPAPTTNNFGAGYIYIWGNLEISGNYSGHGSAGRIIVIYMDGAGKYIDAAGKVIYELVIDVPGSSITVNSSFSISYAVSLSGTLNNSTNNITIGSYGVIYRNSPSSGFTATPIFADYTASVHYAATMTTGNELYPNMYGLFVDISGGGSVTLDKGIAVAYLGLDYANDKLITGSNYVIVDNPGTIHQADNTAYIVGNLEMVYPPYPDSRTFPVGSNSAYRPVTINVTSPIGVGGITVSQTDAAPASITLPGGINRISGVRYWTITPTAGTTADVALSWGADDGVSNGSEIEVVHGDHSTGIWDLANGTVSSDTVTGTGFTSFGDFTLGTTGSDNPLPVEITSFTALVACNKVELQWQTATETNSYGFDIEKKVASNQSSAINSSAENWSKVGFVEGKGTTSAPTSYSFSDAVTATGTYLYRLKHISRDGSFEYSKETEATISFTPKMYQLGQNYPNPFNPTTTISFSLPSQSFVSLQVFDMLGREQSTIVSGELQAGNYTQKWNAENMASGVYYYRLQAGTYNETKKLLLLK